MRYTQTVTFQPTTIGKKCIAQKYDSHWVPTPFPNNPIWSRIDKEFNPEHFLYPCPPIDMGKIELNGTTDIRVLRCPIKKRADNTIYLPKELEFCAPLVQFCVETELNRLSTGKFGYYYAHISYEDVTINAGTSQRAPGWHVDGYQGVKVKRHPIEHSYIWTDSDDENSATEFCIQPFYLDHLDASRHNVFDEMNRQAIPANCYRGINKHLYIIDPYVVHGSPVLSKATRRRFARVTFSDIELEDPMNTTNLGIDMEQKYPKRLDVRDRLSAYDGATPWQVYGLKGKCNE